MEKSYLFQVAQKEPDENSMDGGRKRQWLM
jgi:hypothetical protein